MKAIKVILAYRSPGRFWSIECLFDCVAKAFPALVDVAVATAPCGRANLRSLLANLLWFQSLKDCDVIHQTGDIHYAILAVWRKPVVLTIHDLRFIEEAHGLKRILFWWLWLYLPCLRASRVTVISEFTKARLLALCRINSTKVHVIPDCVGPEFTAVTKSWPVGKPRLLFVGTTENKNLPRMAKACAGLSVHLVVLGKLSPAQHGLLLGEGLAFEQHSNLNRQEVIALYSGCDLVAFPSTYEGFGMPIIEGQAVGRPVLTSDLSPMREVAGGGALLVDPLSVEAIRAGLLRLLNDAGLRENLVAAGFKNVQQYSASAVAMQYANLYGKVLAAS